MIRLKSALTLLLIVLLSASSGLSQVNISGVINANVAVDDITQPNCSDCDEGCDDLIEVSDASAFQVGDRALIIQMKGASINTSNTSSGGQITDIANAGNYEFFIIDSIDQGNDILIPRYGLIKNYNESGQVQVIRIPKYGNNTVTVTDTLTAPTWSESAGVGGVVALVAKKLVLNADINVIGAGFKGTQMNVNGTPDNCSVNPTSAYTLNSTASQSYTKGEGIVPDNTSINRGRAPRANGGGSGISGDSGGGGGSSYGSGGIGGKRWCNVGGTPAGGLGGVALSSYFLQDKVFLGGAGGAGFVTTNNPSNSTDGGGIVILFVDTIVGNGYSILADGTSPVGVNPVGAPDGGGGGGGGGTVLLNVLDIQGNLTVTADGGDGQDLNTTNYHGPGGGGGGGVLLYSLPTLPANVTFSADGGRSGQHSDGYENDAGDGADGGTFGLYVPIENVNYRANVDGDDVAGVCDIDDDNDGIPDVQEIYSGDHDNDGIFDFEDADFCDAFFDGVNGWDCSTDGLPNPTGDLDGDGYPNFFDADFPYCGSFVLGIDQICSNFDPDGDGIPSHLDLDSDNDGIPDIIEAGGADTNGDGQADAMLDIDGDGLIDLYDNDDTDGPLGVSPCSPQPGCLENNSYTTLPVYDTDNDTIPDYLDADSDNDGIPDVIEAGGADGNGDGIIDNYGDADGDGFTDRFDATICSDDVSFTTAFGLYLNGPSTGITNGNNASGAPNGTFAQVYDAGDRLVLDLGQVFPTGTLYQLVWRRKVSYGSGPTADMVVEESADGASYSTNSITPQDASQTFITTYMTTENPTRYLRLSTLTGTNDDFEFDGVVAESAVEFTTCVSGTPLFVTGPDNNNDGFPDSYPGGDSDGDGIFDYRDLDSDNDGVPDVVEVGGTDANGDGIADNYIDGDGDGFNDWVDGDSSNALVLGDDSPGSNFANVLFLTGPDNDVDGFPDSIIDQDNDGDGIPNQLDLDSDNDGITDVIEAGGTDANEDGLVDGHATDSDDDGFADAVDGDVGNDGTAENSSNALVLTGPDSNADGAPDNYPNGDVDEDGILNPYDIDSDNDGITDNTEAQLTVSYITPSGSDTDNDGLDNAYDPTNSGTYLVPVNSDVDTIPDFLDTDSDDDTYPDLIEGHDMNADGIPDPTSPANTGVGGVADADEDGLLDGWDNNTALADPTNGGLSPTSHPDAMNPGNDRDWRELRDSDDDGVADHLDRDDDNDGTPDVDESFGYDPDGNEDGDEYPNWLDVSDDGNGGDGSSTDYTDANNDGIADVYDFDMDGIPNHLDKDSDNDGIVDILEAGGVDSNEDGEVDYFVSGDPSSMIDADLDGLWDDIDDLDNGSGAGEVTSGTPLPLFDTDGTGNEDFLDIDSDGDGIIDNIEAQETVNNPLQATAVDTDGDGISDAFDPDNGGTFILPVDTDEDGTADYRDTDSDNDGENDLLEGWDTDGDGTANTIPANSDSDGDGLDDNFDDVAGIDATTNMSNNGQNAFDFPDADLGTLERDWREEPCANSYIALTSVNRTTASPNFCIDGSWIYYYVDIDSVETLNPGDSSILMMAIEHQPFGAGANTNDFAVEVSTTVSSNPLISAGVYSEEDIANEQATFVMGRYWNIDLISGSLNGFVNVRFYYAQGESDELVNTAQTWNATYADSTAFVSGLRWFAVNAGDFDPSADLTAAGVQGASQLYPTSSTEDGILYAEFELSSFTGGGLGFTVGENSVILPVELTTFDANLLADETVLVEWATASEVNNDYFMVERSADMENWTDLGKVLGAGNASTQNYYQFIDNNPLSGKSYYRLRQVDFDGGKDYSESREVLLMQDGRDQKVLLYPNPSRNEVYLSVTSEKESRFVVRNAMGQTIKTLHAVGTETLIIDDLSAGVYYLQTVGHSDASTLRFVITK